MQTLLYLYIASSVFLALISLPLIARKIKPNPFYGFRVKQTLDDPEVWYETNQYFAKRLFAVGILEALASIGFYFIPNITVDAYALLWSLYLDIHDFNGAKLAAHESHQIYYRCLKQKLRTLKIVRSFCAIA